MKNKILLLLVLCFALLLCGCSGQNTATGDNSNMETDDNINNNAVNDAENSSDDNSSSENVDGNNTSDRTLPQLWLDNEDVWADLENMPSSGVSGAYGTGYTLFDIDLDGEKEMIVQYGGGSMHNCLSLVYELEGNNVVSSPFGDNIEEGNFSMSIYDLSLYAADDDTMFYINHPAFRIDNTNYVEQWSKISVDGSGYASFETLFSCEIHYSDNGSETRSYFIGEENVDEFAFTEAFNSYFDTFDNIPVEYVFISSSDWAGYSEEEKLSALTASYEA